MTNPQTNVTLIGTPNPALVPVPPAMRPDELALEVWPINTDDRFEFRILLRDEEAEGLVRQRVRDGMIGMWQALSNISFGELTDLLLANLCGPEPLSQPSLLAFLDAVGAEAVSLLQQRVINALAIQPTPVVNAPADTQTRQSLDGQTSRLGLVEEGQPPLRLSPMAVDAHPDRARRILEGLTQLATRNPRVARQLRLVEFAGSTEEELALYFGENPEEIRAEIDIAAAEIMASVQCDV